MERRPLGEIDVRWRLVLGSVLLGLVLGVSVLGLGLWLSSGADADPRRGLLAGLLCAPLLAGGGGGLLAYARADKLKLLHGGLAVSISFGLILIFLCAFVILGSWLIEAVR